MRAKPLPKSDDEIGPPKPPRWLAVIAAAMLFGCTTYHASGPSGGFSEVRLNEASYQVRFRGNGYTSGSRVATFLLRRSAELALENGYRYFTISGEQVFDRSDFMNTYPERAVTVRFVTQPAVDTMDAVTVVKSTNEDAGGRLSEAAQTTLRTIAASP